MRVLIALLLLGVSGLAEAQPPAAAKPAPTSTLVPIELPLAPIGLSLPPIGLTPADTTRVITRGPASPERQTRHGRSGQAPRGPGVVYVVPVLGWTVDAPGRPASGPLPAEASAPPVTGMLRLDLQPRPTGQLFVDGAYVGTVDELGADLTLLAGTRQLELRQPGYRPFTLTAHIQVGQVLVYRGALEPDGVVAPPPAPPELPMPAISHKAIYFIPGCYLGDVPPQEAGLPPTCDLSRAVVFRP